MTRSGDCRQIDKMHSLFTDQSKDIHRQTGRVLRKRGGQVAWCTSEYCVRLRSEVHVEVMVVDVGTVGHLVKKELGLSSSNRWLI